MLDTSSNTGARGQPILIIGGGHGGLAMLEMFLDDTLVTLVGVVDTNVDAPGMVLAREKSIPAYSNLKIALEACKHYPECIVYNLTHDDSLGAVVKDTLGYSGATGGIEAKLIWQMVTNLKRVKHELQASQNQLKAIFDNALDGIIISDAVGAVRGFNPAAETLFGYEQQEVFGRHISSLIPDARGVPHSAGIERTVQTAKHLILSVTAHEFTAIRKSGTQFPIELSASEMRLENELFFIGIVRDITERKNAELRIQRLAHHDFLTQLPNRALFKDRLEQAIAQAQRNCARGAVLFLDLDGFKNINDSFGHESGDELLCEVAARLKTAVRHVDTVARMGGDEFTVVLNDIGPPGNAALVARNILMLIAQPMLLGGEKCSIQGSVGAAIFPDDAIDYESLLRFSDEAMYRAKQAGKNMVCMHGDTAHGVSPAESLVSPLGSGPVTAAQ